MGFGIGILIGAIFGCSFGYVLGAIMRTGKQAEMMQADIAEQNLRSAQLQLEREPELPLAA
jgi:membrane protein DedA with SNARE-associated domain